MNPKKHRACLFHVAVSATLAAILALWISNVASAAQKQKTITLDGITLKMPKGYQLFPNQPASDSALMFGRNQDGIFMVVSQGPTPKDPSDIVKSELKQLYPKESQMYSWKELPLPARLSKFELSGLAVNGYNGNQMVKVVFRNVAIGDKIVAVGEIFELAQGAEARQRFEGNMEAISLGLCNVFLEAIFPLTKEKIDPKNPPCELIVDSIRTTTPKP